MLPPWCSSLGHSICYHVRHNQKGWVCTLPRIRFDTMNSVNASTRFSNFQIHLGQSLHLIPPLIPDSLSSAKTPTDEARCAQKLIMDLQTDVNKRQFTTC